MDTLLQDLRDAFRSLRKAPMITGLAVVCLAIGIGVNTSIFSVVEAIILRPLDFKDPQAIVLLHDSHVKTGNDNRQGISYVTFQELDDRTSSYVELAANSGRSMTLADGDEPERFFAGTVSWNLFPMLGKDPILGRHFRQDEDRLGAPGTVLLSHDLWTRRFQSDPQIVGRVLTLNRRPHTVVGVMPPKFQFPDDALLWVPIEPFQARNGRADRGVAVYARLAPGVTLERANQELRAVSTQLAREFPGDHQGWVLGARGIREAFLEEEVTLVVLAMMGAVTCVLLIACANVANLLLTRASARHREIAIRSAIGAGRGRIIRQLLTESVVIALIGGALGVLVAYWGLDLIDAAIPPEDSPPYYIDWSINATVLAYTLIVSVVTGMLFGIAPAIQSARGNLQNALKEGARGSAAGGRHRLRNGLVIAEVAMSLVLLVSAALFVRSFMALQTVDLGFDHTKLMTTRIYLPGEAYESDEAKRTRLEDVVRRIEAIPAVASAVASNTIAIDGGGSGDGIVVEGSDVAPGDEPLMNYAGVTDGWFQTYGVPIVKGRDLTEAETQDSSGVAVVTQAFAKALWKDQDPLGRRFRFRSDRNQQWITVVGIAKDFTITGVDDRDPQGWAFLGYPYVTAFNNGITIRVKQGNPANVMPEVRKAIRAADSGLPIFEVATMDQVRKQSFWQYAFFGSMFSAFGVIALVLALVGVYGVISYGVSQRTHEIGVRMALGAKDSDVLRMIVGQGLALAGIGIAIGLVGAFGAGRAVASLLWTSPSDPVSFAGIAALLTGTAAVASWFPARRAARVDPMIALRDE